MSNLNSTAYEPELRTNVIRHTIIKIDAASVLNVTKYTFCSLKHSYAILILVYKLWENDPINFYHPIFNLHINWPELNEIGALIDERVLWDNQMDRIN